MVMGDDVENVWILKDKATGAMIRVKAAQQDEQHITMFAYLGDNDWPETEIAFGDGVITLSIRVGSDRAELQQHIYFLGENKDVQ
jgi:hypothetical protein